MFQINGKSSLSLGNWSLILPSHASPNKVLIKIETMSSWQMESPRWDLASWSKAKINMIEKSFMQINILQVDILFEIQY